MKASVSNFDRSRSSRKAGSIGKLLPTITLILIGAWLGRNAAAALGGDTENTDPRVCLTHADPTDRMQCLDSTVSERRIRKVSWQSLQGTVTANKSRTSSNDSVLVESTRPVRIEAGSAEYWAAHPTLWTITAVKVGDLVYPRESLMTQILRASGRDPALALAKELAVYRIASAASPEAFASSEPEQRQTILDRADTLIAKHPPGSFVNEDVVSEMQQLQMRLAAWNRSDEVIALLR